MKKSEIRQMIKEELLREDYQVQLKPGIYRLYTFNSKGQTNETDQYVNLTKQMKHKDAIIALAGPLRSKKYSDSWDDFSLWHIKTKFNKLVTI